MCNLYGLNYHVAGTTTATSVEANGDFFFQNVRVISILTPFSLRSLRKSSSCLNQILYFNVKEV